MTIIYFLGGSDIIRKGEAKPIHRRAFKEASRTPHILVFPWTMRMEKRKYRKVMESYFKSCGARLVCFSELTDSLQVLQKKISLSDVIYLPGGDPFILTKRMNKAGLIAALKTYEGTIIGNSAGSLALCKKYVVIKGQDGEPTTKLNLGIGIVEFSISVHYKSKIREYSGDKPDIELRMLSKKIDSPIYAIPENGALIYNKGNLRFIGKIYLFNKGKKPTKCQ